MTHAEVTPSGTPRPSPTERRLATIDAFIDLALEHGIAPRPEQVAERSGVSQATLYRYFANLDELRRLAIGRLADRFPELVAVPTIGTGSRPRRIADFVETRIRLHETLHPIQLLARSSNDPSAADLVDEVRRAMADQIGLHFDDELRTLDPERRADTVAVAATVTSVEAWEQHHRTLERSPAAIRRSWVDAIDALLPPSHRADLVQDPSEETHP